MRSVLILVVAAGCGDDVLDSGSAPPGREAFAVAPPACTLAPVAYVAPGVDITVTWSGLHLDAIGDPVPDPDEFVSVTAWPIVDEVTGAPMPLDRVADLCSTDGFNTEQLGPRVAPGRREGEAFVVLPASLFPADSTALLHVSDRYWGHAELLVQATAPLSDETTGLDLDDSMWGR